MNPPNISPTTFCVVRSGGTLYALPAYAIREVLDWQTPVPVPLAPPHVAGLLIYQGDVLTVLCLDALLGQSASCAKAALVILEDPNSGERFVLTVDSAEQVITIAEVDLALPPPTLSPAFKAMLLGLCRCAGELVLVLNLSALTPDSLLDHFDPPGGVANKGEPCAH